MFIRKLQHSLFLMLAKTLTKFAPGARHMVYAGSGSAGQLCSHILRTGVKRVLVVTDKPLRELGIVDQALSVLNASDVDIEIFDGVLPDPTFGCDDWQAAQE
jgi:alcohol dehydrogenase class IV